MAIHMDISYYVVVESRTMFVGYNEGSEINA